MKDNHIYEILNQPEPAEDKKRVLRAYLHDQIQNYHTHPHEAERIAYAIAGLLSTQMALNLPPDDPYIQVLSMAARLELPAEHRDDGSTWPNFIHLVSELPDAERQ